MTEIRLYTTLGCHLCEQAEALIHEHLAQTQNDWRLQSVEISASDALIDRYGIRIPVVGMGDRELDWPFDLARLQRFLARREAAQ